MLHVKPAIVAIVLLLVASAASEELFDSPTQRATANHLKCILILDNPRWSEPADTRIRVRVVNVSDEPIELRTFPVFYLQSQTAKPWQVLDYWGPADLRAGAPAPVVTSDLNGGHSISPQPQILRFEPNGESEFVVHATNLKWDKQISSVWPSFQFFKCVQGGTYKLYLELGHGLRSNHVFVAVEPKSK